MKALTPLRIAAIAILSTVAAAAYADLGSRLATKIRFGSPLTALVSIERWGQGGVEPPAFYLLVLGTASGSADLVRIPSSSSVFERTATGERSNLRSLADVYGDVYSRGEDRAQAAATTAEAALTMLQAEPSWPELPSGADGGMPAPLDVSASFAARQGVSPGYPLEMHRALKEALTDPFYWPRAPQLIRAVRGSDTGLSSYDLFLMLRVLRRVDPDRLRISDLSDPETASLTIRSAFERAAGRETEIPSKELEVLNASGSDGLALKATKILRLRGFDVVHFAGSPGEENATVFIDKTGSVSNAAKAAAALGCPEPAILTALEAQARTAVSVVLGRDFKACTALGSDAPES